MELGVLTDEGALADALARQSERLPLASVCYVLGYADERALAEALTISAGRPAVVLDECVVDTELIDGNSPDLLRRLQMLPVYAEAGIVYVAAARPEEVAGHAQALLARHGRVAMCVALAVTLARAIRGVIAARGRDEACWIGPEAATDGPARHPRLALVRPDDTVDEDLLGERAEQAVLEDVTKEIKVDDLLHEGAEDPAVADVSTRAASVGGDTPWQVTGVAPLTGRDSSPGPPDDDIAELSRHLERGPVLAPGGVPRLLIVDDDFATRHLLVKELEPRGYEVATAASGTDALAVLRNTAPDVIIADILLPGVDGFRLCRAIKATARLEGVGVILMSAVIDSGRVTGDVLQRYGADGYAAKPLDTPRLLRHVRVLLERRRTPAHTRDQKLAHAIER
jgi:CheY-like chemotaxis protein